ncbi:ribosome small subunit-dependent GTPase A [Amorphoplanes nipponensis]|uniref:Small ribosomal subunit biogenesis GTPase RsgA n=1 Tax=Actinoplanes nipponensis TaxID=135950 RepID=A0A919JC45_9ACTN|nr:ribosome small subunit-dependent GTPase A [Actinoplanes nipponensis]GIE46650.1 putative ribosome biogenesis GTPase RsgA [Actinoplanes nipponensis]
MSDLSALGWDETLASAYRNYDRPDAAPARVLRADRGVCTVLDASGVSRASLAGTVLLGAARDPAQLPCAGDWVVLRRWPDRRTTVEGVLPRRAALIRRTSDKDSVGQVLAANMDTVAVVEPMHPAPDDARLERLLALAWESGARPVIVLSKSDTARDPQAVARQLGELAPGVRVLPVSVHAGTGLDALRPYVAPGRTLALLGRSGAGKSSLVNALAGAEVMGVQEIRRADGKGRHTTAYRSLVLIPGGGAVLDTPGIRGVGLLDTAEGLDRAFADVAALAGRCRFGDCGHDGEPGCAVAAALADGTLPARRLDSWRKLHREVAVESSRRAARLAQAAGSSRRRPRR